MLRLKVVSPDSTKSLSVSNEINFKQLKGVIVESFQDQSIKEEDFDILYGFPPEVCTLSDDQLICPTLNSGMTLRMVIKTSTCTSSLSTSSQVPLNNVHKRKASKTTDTLQGTKKQISILRNLDASSKTFSVSVKSAPTPIKNKPRVRKMKSSDHASSENDIIEHLIEALNGGKGNRNKILRKAFRNAVSLQYNSSKAVARLSSLYAGTSR